eukprot:42451-Prymnesium_polylepis.1
MKPVFQKLLALELDVRRSLAGLDHGPALSHVAVSQIRDLLSVVCPRLSPELVLRPTMVKPRYIVRLLSQISVPLRERSSRALVPRGWQICPLCLCGVPLAAAHARRTGRTSRHASTTMPASPSSLRCPERRFPGASASTWRRPDANHVMTCVRRRAPPGLRLAGHWSSAYSFSVGARMVPPCDQQVDLAK